MPIPRILFVGSPSARMCQRSILCTMFAVGAPVVGWLAALLAVRPDGPEPGRAALLAVTVGLGALALVCGVAALAFGLAARALAKPAERTFALVAIGLSLCAPATWAIEWLIVGAGAIAWFLAE